MPETVGPPTKKLAAIRGVNGDNLRIAEHAVAALRRGGMAVEIMTPEDKDDAPKNSIRVTNSRPARSQSATALNRDSRVVYRVSFLARLPRRSSPGF